MKLKAILDSVSDLPDAIKAYYVEKDGKFVLQIEGVADHPDAKALKSALDRERDEKKAAKDKLTAIETRVSGLPEDFDLAAYNRLMDTAKDKDVDARLEEQKNRLTKQFDTEKATLTADRDKWKTASESEAKTSTLTKAIAEANIAPQFVEAVEAMFAGKIHIAHEGDKLITTIDSLPVADALKAFATSDKGKAFVQAPGNGGGGSGGNPGSGGEVNPWAKDTLNLTEQGRIYRADPAKAERLQRAAGK